MTTLDPSSPAIANFSNARILKGDGSWPFVAYVIGDDIWLIHVPATCFGGSDDPEDDGSTASGVSTKTPGVLGCSLPMDARGKNFSSAAHKALDGCPIPWLPWKTMVEVTCGAITFQVPLIDDGPAKWTKNAIDLVQDAARKIDPAATSRNFGRNVNVRIIGGAKYAPQA